MITCGLGNLSAAFDEMRTKMFIARYRAGKAEAQLEELRMRIHQFAVCKGEAKEAARSFLKAEAIDYHRRVTK